MRNAIKADLRRLPRFRLKKSKARELHQVQITLLILHQKGERAVRLAPCRATGRFGGFIQTHRQRTPRDGLDAFLRHCFGKFERAEKVARVGKRDGGHTVGATKLRQILDPDRAFKERIGRVEAEVDELGHRVDHEPLSDAGRPKSPRGGVAEA